MAPRKENRSERRRIATEREKKRIEAFNQQVERVRELVCPEMSCATKSKVLRAAVDRLNYLERLAEQLSAAAEAPMMTTTVTVAPNSTVEQVYFENESSSGASGYNSDECAPVNYAQHAFVDQSAQNSNSSVEFTNDTGYGQGSHAMYNEYYPDVQLQYSIDADNATSKQDSYDNFFREFLNE